jgi:hypothetical protein
LQFVSFLEAVVKQFGSSNHTQFLSFKILHIILVNAPTFPFPLIYPTFFSTIQ